MTDRSIGVEGETGGEAKGSGTGRHGIVRRRESDWKGLGWRGKGLEMVVALGAGTAWTRVPGHEKRAGVTRGFHWSKDDKQ